MFNSIPHLLIWTEERNIVVSSIIIPGKTACSYFIYLNNELKDTNWKTLAAQAYFETPILIPQYVLITAQAFALNTIISYANKKEFHVNTLVKIPPIPHQPYFELFQKNKKCHCEANM